MKKPVAGVHNENRVQKKMFISDDFWVKERRHSENTFAKKRYTSIVARVEYDSLYGTMKHA